MELSLDKTKKKVLLVFHGNGGNAAGWSSHLKSMNRAFDKIYVNEYPGYGRFFNNPPVNEISKELIIREAMNALTTLRSIHPKHAVYLMGISMGTGVGCEVAAKCPDLVDGLILLTPFLSIAKVIHRWTAWLIQDNFSCEEWLPKCSKNLPIFIVGGVKDRLTPLWHARELATLVPNAKLYTFDGSHNEAFYARFLKQWWSP